MKETYTPQISEKNQQIKSKRSCIQILIKQYHQHKQSKQSKIFQKEQDFNKAFLSEPQFYEEDTDFFINSDEVPIESNQPLFQINQNLQFIDNFTHQSYQQVTYYSLPLQFKYYTTPNDQKPMLCLDLDETLIYSSQYPQQEYEKTMVVQNKQFYLKIRPGTKHFLNLASQYFELSVFTFSISEYAENIVEIIDPQRQLIKYIFSRRNCVKTNKGKVIKDLSRIGRRLCDICLIDNLKEVGEWQPNNCIVIEEYKGLTTEKNNPNLFKYHQYKQDETTIIDQSVKLTEDWLIMWKKLTQWLNWREIMLSQQQ